MCAEVLSVTKNAAGSSLPSSFLKSSIRVSEAVFLSLGVSDDMDLSLTSDASSDVKKSIELL